MSILFPNSLEKKYHSVSEIIGRSSSTTVGLVMVSLGFPMLRAAASIFPKVTRPIFARDAVVGSLLTPVALREHIGSLRITKCFCPSY